MTLRGVNDAGGEFGAPLPTAATATFSNANPGVYDAAYHFDKAGTLTYLAGRGIKTVRLPFRLERLFTPAGTMVVAERDRIRRYLNDAATAGVGVILDAHNYGAYYVHDGTQGVRRAVGSAEFPRSVFAEMCRLAYAEWGTLASFIGMGLMNEPVAIPESMDRTGPQLVTNGGFEVDTAGWVAGTNTTIARSTTRAHAGTAALTLTATAAGDASATTDLAVAATETIVAEAFASHDGTARTIGIQIDWRTSTGYLATSSGTFKADAGTFGAWRIQATAPAGATIGRLKLLVQAAAAGEVHRIDAVSAGVGTLVTGAASWELAARAAITAIRGVSSKQVFAGTYSYSSLKNVATHHPDGFLRGIAGVVVEMHYYPDRDNSGQFVNTYDAEVTDAAARGFAAGVNADALQTRVLAEIQPGLDWAATNGQPVLIGEIGWPSENNVTVANADKWAGVGEKAYQKLDAAGASVTQWTTGEWWNATNENLAFKSSAGAAGTVDTVLRAGLVVEAHLAVIIFGPYSAEIIVVTPTTTVGPYSEIIVVTPTSGVQVDRTVIVPRGSATARGRLVGANGIGLPPVVVTPPVPVEPAVLEGLILDGLALNNEAAGYVLEALTINPPAKKPEWVTGADTDGAYLGRDPLFDNRVITARVRVVERATMDEALEAVGAISDRLEEAERNTDGVPVEWLPARSTDGLTFRCLTGEIKNMPLAVQGDDVGWWLDDPSPVLDLELTCLPFGDGVEVTSQTVTSSQPLLTLTLPNVPGDVPAKARLIVTDAAGQSRRYLEWGVEQRHFNAATSLLVDSDSMTVTGFAGFQATRAGAYDANLSGGNSIQANLNLGGQTVAVCGTGNLGHSGTFRVKARVQTDPSVLVRLAWTVGPGQQRHNDWATVQRTSVWYELDLGLITIPTARVGGQAWTGQIETQMVASPQFQHQLWIDHLLLIPVDQGYGRVSAPASSNAASAVVAYDQFNSTLGSSVLNGRVAPSGGTWFTSGAGTSDFVFYDFADGNESIGRGTSSDAARRFAILGTATYTDSQIRVAFRHNVRETVMSAAVLRWVDANNFAFFEMDGYHPGALYLGVVVGGVRTNLAWVNYGFDAGAWKNLQLTCYSSGRMIGVFSTSSGTLLTSFETSSPALATGGTLATGLPGLFDVNPFPNVVCTRYYDEVNLLIPAREPVALHPGRQIEIRHDAAVMQNSTGTAWGNTPTYRGSRFFVEPSGSENRTSRVAVKAHRTNIETAPSEQVTDALTATVRLTPRYLVVPRQG